MWQTDITQRSGRRMKRRTLFTRGLAAALATGMTATCLPALAGNSNRGAGDCLVETVQMPAWINKDGQRLPLAPGDTVAAVQEVETGVVAALVLKMPDGNLIRLGEKTRLGIQTLEANPSGASSIAGATNTAGAHMTAGAMQPGKGMAVVGGRWRVVAAAAPTANAAAEMVAMLAAQGYPAQVRAKTLAGRPIHEVRINGFATKDDAAAVLEKITMMSGIKGRVALSAQAASSRRS
jgi:hypothetical protein